MGSVELSPALVVALWMPHQHQLRHQARCIMVHHLAMKMRRYWQLLTAPVCAHHVALVVRPPVPLTPQVGTVVCLATPLVAPDHSQTCVITCFDDDDCATNLGFSCHDADGGLGVCAAAKSKDVSV